MEKEKEDVCLDVEVTEGALLGLKVNKIKHNVIIIKLALTCTCSGQLLCPINVQRTFASQESQSIQRGFFLVLSLVLRGYSLGTTVP